MDVASRYEFLFFLDASSSYNQICLNPLDQKKITFISEKRTFCLKVMPFGLKNTRATYQRMVKKVFRGLIGKILKA